MSNEKLNLQELLNKLQGMKVPQEEVTQKVAPKEEPTIPIHSLELLASANEELNKKYIEQLKECTSNSSTFQQLCNTLLHHGEMLMICRALAALALQMQLAVMYKYKVPIQRFADRIVINRDVFEGMYSYVCGFLRINEDKKAADTIWDIVYTISNIADAERHSIVDDIFHKSAEIEDPDEAIDYLKANIGPAIDKTDVPEQTKDNIKEIINKLLNKDE